MNINSAPTRDNRRVLLVAANLTFRSWSTTLLREAGCRADSEANAEKAWAALRSRGYELIIIDYNLPGTSGLRFILKMRHARLTVPAVLITETTPLLDPGAHRQLRSISVVLRPFTVEQLVAMVAEGTRDGQASLADRRLPLLDAAPLTPPRRHRYQVPEQPEFLFENTYGHSNYKPERAVAWTGI